MPLIDEPFQRVAVDLVGPIQPATTKGNWYILTLVDYATRFPEIKCDTKVAILSDMVQKNIVEKGESH